MKTIVHWIDTRMNQCRTAKLLSQVSGYLGEYLTIHKFAAHNESDIQRHSVLDRIIGALGSRVSH